MFVYPKLSSFSDGLSSVICARCDTCRSAVELWLAHEVLEKEDTLEKQTRADRFSGDQACMLLLLAKSRSLCHVRYLRCVVGRGARLSAQLLKMHLLPLCLVYHLSLRTFGQRVGIRTQRDYGGAFAVVEVRLCFSKH